MLQEFYLAIPSLFKNIVNKGNFLNPTPNLYKVIQHSKNLKKVKFSFFYWELASMRVSILMITLSPGQCIMWKWLTTSWLHLELYSRMPLEEKVRL